MLTCTYHNCLSRMYIASGHIRTCERGHGQILEQLHLGVDIYRRKHVIPSRMQWKDQHRLEWVGGREARMAARIIAYTTLINPLSSSCSSTHLRTSAKCKEYLQCCTQLSTNPGDGNSSQQYQYYRQQQQQQGQQPDWR